MIRIHLAQILFSPAYFEGSIDYLEEPVILPHNNLMGGLASIDAVGDFLSGTKRRYMAHIEAKLLGIAEASGEMGAHLLVFPEYSVPPELLTDLVEVAKRHSMIIVAGSHRVKPTDEPFYSALKLTEKAEPGSAFSPVILPEGTVRVAGKLSKSKWEPNIILPYGTRPFAEEVDCRGVRFLLTVLVCIDCLQPALLGQVWKDTTGPKVIVCPSLSPTIDKFHEIGIQITSKGAVLGFVNCASDGGTAFNIPKTWQEFLQGTPLNSQPLPAKAEAILELKVNPAAFHLPPRGSIDVSPIAYHPLSFPIVYKKEADWMRDFLDLRVDIQELLQSYPSEAGLAIDLISAYLTDNKSKLPEHLSNRLAAIRTGPLRNFDGNVEFLNNALRVIAIEDQEISTSVFWAERADRAFQVLTESLAKADKATIPSISRCLVALRAESEKLPPFLSGEEDSSDAATPDDSGETSESVFLGQEDLQWIFQNRGKSIDELQEILRRPNFKVIVLTGPVGIGKTGFLHYVRQKTLVDWQFLHVPVPSDSFFAKTVAQIASKLKIQFDVDALASLTKEPYRKRVKRVVDEFFKKQKRMLVLDDIRHVLETRCRRDQNHLKIFIEEATNPGNFVGGRVVLVHSGALPNAWKGQPGIAIIRLGRLENKYVRRILNYELRKADLIAGEEAPNFPVDLVDLAGGNPLVARLAAMAWKAKKQLPQVEGKVAEAMLQELRISRKDETVLQKLSVFRGPMRLDTITKQRPHFAERDLLDLSRRCIIDFDGVFLQMHEVVRRFFYSKIVDAEKKSNYHKIASNYCEQILKSTQPTATQYYDTAAEFIYHRSLAGEFIESSLLSKYVEEVKHAALKLYRERNFEKAHELCKFVITAVSDDLDVRVLLARCYGRLLVWEKCDTLFQDSVSLASSLGKLTWWIYRDWGRLLFGCKRFDEAKQKLVRSKELFSSEKNPHILDPILLTCLGRMHEHFGQRDEAETCFEYIFAASVYHPYALFHGNAFFEKSGKAERATEMGKRLASIRSDAILAEACEYDSGVDDDL